MWQRPELHNILCTYVLGYANAHAKSIKVAKDCNFFPLILQVYSTKQLEEIHKRTSCTKILKKKLTVDGGMAVQIPQLFG